MGDFNNNLLKSYYNRASVSSKCIIYASGSGLARFSHPGKYRAVNTILEKTSNSGNNRDKGNRLKRIIFEAVLQ